MPISYMKLFQLMKEKNIKKIDLRTKYGINPKTVNSLTKNKSVTVDTLVQLCKILDCNIDDIVDYIPDSNDSNVKNIKLESTESNTSNTGDTSINSDSGFGTDLQQDNNT